MITRNSLEIEQKAIMTNKEMLTVNDAPAEIQHHMLRYGQLYHDSRKRKQHEGIATGALLIGGLIAFSGMFFPEAGLGGAAATLGLAAAIAGGVVLYSGKSEAKLHYLRTSDIEKPSRRGAGQLWISHPWDQWFRERIPIKS